MKLSTLQPAQIAAENWAYPTNIVPRRWQDLVAVKAAFFKRSETLGTDGGDAGYAVSHGNLQTAAALYTRLTTGNVLNSRVYSYGSHAIALLQKMPRGVAPTRICFEAEASLEQTAACALSIGFTSYTVIEQLDQCAHIFYDSTVGANFQARSSDGVEEQTDTAVAADTSLHVFHISFDATDAKFYIDGALTATHSTRIPDGGSAASEAYATVLLKTNAAAVKYARYTYVAVWLE